MSDAPRVSVVLAVRDEAAHIEGALASIARQTLGDWELVVVDDGSTDGTPELVRRSADPRIRLLERRAEGHTPALMAGFSAARAPFVARLDADDPSEPERLARQLEHLEAHPDVAVVGTGWIERDASGAQVRPRTTFTPGPLHEALRRGNPVMHASAMVRADVFRTLGGYDPRFRYAQDYDLWLRADFAGFGVHNLDEPLATRTMTGTNIAARRERAQIVEELIIRGRDARRRARRGDRDVPERVARLLTRAAVLLLPLSVKRLKRRVVGQAR